MILPEAIPFSFASFYESVVSRRVLAEEYKRIASAIDLPSGLILDIGTGPGSLAIEIASRNRAVNVVGVDMSEAMIRLARRKAGNLPNVRFRVMNARRLLLAESSVDLVLSTSSMHHWREPELIFREMHRVMRPGARALIYDIRSDATRQEVFAELVRRRPFPPRFAVLRVFRFHGFTRKSLETKIIPVIAAGPFRGARVETEGLWYRLILVKN